MDQKNKNKTKNDKNDQDGSNNKSNGNDSNGQNRKRRRSKKLVEAKPEENMEIRKPLPPNVFLYIQLADIQVLPQTINRLELHLAQGDSVIVKCVEHYNTDGIIYQEEFDSRPTFTLIIPQDNIERINQVSDNPLLIKLYMRVPPPEIIAEEEGGEEDFIVLETASHTSTARDFVEKRSENDRLDLISVGYIDLLKLFAKRRTMVKEYLYLYPVPNVPNELRITTHSEWHLYTLLPLIKEITIVNMAFVIFESIFNFFLPNPFLSPKLKAELNFRSTIPNEKNEYHTVPFCEFNSLMLSPICEQVSYQIYENLYLNGYGNSPVHALQTPIEVEKHRLFKRLMRSDGLNANFDYISYDYDDAYISNSFHRYALTKDCSTLLFSLATCHTYDIMVEIYSVEEPREKLFEGVLNPVVLAYPKVRSVRFAVELRYVGAAKKHTIKRNTQTSVSRKSHISQQSSLSDVATFAIVRICLFTPLGETSKELHDFNESFVNQNRLQMCHIEEPKEPTLPPIEDVISDAYGRFDTFIDNTISYILSRCIHNVAEKKDHFCCDVNNLINILLRLVGCAFNHFVETKTNIDFTNLCVDAYNQLELRVHEKVEKRLENRAGETTLPFKEEFLKMIDFINTFKFLTEVGDTAMADLLLDKILNESKLPELRFFKLIHDMEQKNYDAAKEFFEQPAVKSVANDYFSGWIKLYLTHMNNQANEETAPNALEFLLRDITNYAELHAKQTDGWILLHCYYKRYNYWPGVDYARWRYEDLYDKTRDKAAGAPWNLMAMYLHYSPNLRTTRNRLFFDVQRVFMRLGLYEFAEVICEVVLLDCSELERYLFTAAHGLLNKSLDEKFKVRNFPMNASGQYETSFINQINGSIEYYRGNWEQAKMYYMRNINASEIDSEDFVLSSLRLAYLAFASGDYQVTIAALSREMPGELLNVVNNYMIGRAYYRLNNMSMALEHFAKSTVYNIHVPDIWAYLALINLRGGEIFNALECWKHAKYNPADIISEEIYDELDKIDYDDCDLYIDIKMRSY